ncbi:glycosyltransferase family 4 protein [Phenylobacterium sp.]|uniref:glycosyltransferase family 4 protein n=1 Tax=Phenylobacterium sp. TaxID=1871053 RepID=UPI002BBEB1E5|nr:glycosyltransferase family 4 protein [Phenylobacterium sp.]HLZ77162.1 glycosyltransferase family 4 protein [Phenylobacterium sp.]
MAHPPSDAVIRFEPDGFSLTGPRLMGRQSAGNGFLRAAVQGRLDERVYGYTAMEHSAKRFTAMVKEFDRAAEPVWIPGEKMDLIGVRRGVIYLADPTLAIYARLRQRIGPAKHSLCGVTHTLATAGTLEGISEMLTEAVMPWDALVCTSTAALQVVHGTLGARADFLRWRFGPQARLCFPQLPVIPLGVHCCDFTFTADDKAAARRALGIAEDEVAVLYVGRLLFAGKSHPYPAFTALQAAAERTGKKVVGILCGRAPNDALEQAYLEGAASYGPDVRVLHVDSRADETRRNAWAAGDIFISLSDGIQETFGLTPVEAMAAGLPVVVTDWNGYKDTVRDGVDGFRIDTWAPEANAAGVAYALRQEIKILDFDNYTWAVAAATSVDIKQLSDRLTDLVAEPDLRRRMGEAGYARARELYDWPLVYKQYQALWGELNGRRVAAASNEDETAWVRAAPKIPSSRLDPFDQFGHYPTHLIGARTRVALRPGVTFDDYLARSADPLFPRAGAPESLSRPMWEILEHGPSTVDVLSAAATLSLGWGISVIGAMAKMGVVELSAAEAEAP